MKEMYFLMTFIILAGCSSKNVKELEIFDQADKTIDLIKNKNFKALRETTFETGFYTSLNDTGWINYASPLLKKYVIIDHTSWTLRTTNMGYEVHIPLLNVQEPNIIYTTFDFVLLHTPDNISNKFYDFRLDGELKSARKLPVAEPK